jgi:hypothetical protein
MFHELRYGGFGEGKPPRHLGLALTIETAKAYEPHLVIVKFCRAMSRSTSKSFWTKARIMIISTYANMPLFHVAVEVVLRDGSKRQMVWVYAARVIAIVHDNQAVRYWPVMDNSPRRTMSPNFVFEAKPSVSVFVNIPKPQPASGIWLGKAHALQSLPWSHALPCVSLSLALNTATRLVMAKFDARPGKSNLVAAFTTTTNSDLPIWSCSNTLKHRESRVDCPDLDRCLVDAHQYH